MREQHERGVRRLEFHISRAARDRYQFDQSLFTTTGNVIFANFRAARAFAQRMNQKRDLVNYPEKVVRAGQINAMGLIDEILHYVIGQFQQQRAPQAMAQALAWVEETTRREALQTTLRKFAEAFPPMAVYRQEISLDDYLSGETDGIPNRQLLLEELLMLWLENMNPAYAAYLELFDDAALKKETAYLAVIADCSAFFATQPPFGPDNQPLVDMLRAPAIAVPHSLAGQLEYILTRWGYLLGQIPLSPAEQPGPDQRRREGDLLRLRPVAGLRLQRHGRRAGTLQRRPRLDAAAGADGEKRLRLAGSALEAIWPRHHHAGRHSRTKSWTSWRAGASPACG